MAYLVDEEGNPINKNNPLPASIVGSLANIKTAPLVGVKTVGAVAAELFAGASRLITRGYMEVYNAGANPIYYGASGVTTGTGFPIQPGDSKIFYFSADVPIYFIAVANTTVNVEER